MYFFETDDFQTRLWCSKQGNLEILICNIYLNMSSQQQAIGMMEGAFFVPKGDLMNWVNELLDLEITKIEQLGTGAVYCQIVDAMFPGKVAMQRINWGAKNQWQFINNYKILQQAFSKCKIQKHIDIEKLSKSKYQDNLQFIQWMKRYYDLFNKNTQEKYDAKAARKNAHIDFTFVQYRNPIKRKELDKLEASLNKRAVSKSPYDGVRSKINNRSATIGKYESVKHHKAQIYIEKLCKIRDVLKKSNLKGKLEDPINKIRQIVQEIQEDLPPIQQEISPQAKLETSPSHSMLQQVHRKQKIKGNDKNPDKRESQKKQSQKNIKKAKR